MALGMRGFLYRHDGQLQFVLKVREALTHSGEGLLE